jgi:hypothetical protein
MIKVNSDLWLLCIYCNDVTDVKGEVMVPVYPATYFISEIQWYWQVDYRPPHKCKFGFIA